MKKRLNKSLEKDKFLLKIIKKKLLKINESDFNFNVIISRQKYIKMVKNRYISCLLGISDKQLDKGIDEIKMKFDILQKKNVGNYC